jgi:YesN/AraC family two-component response regulator
MLDEMYDHTVFDEYLTEPQRVDSLRHTSIEKEFIKVFELLKNINKDTSAADKNMLVFNVISIIKETYMENIRVTDIGRQLHVSSTYLSQMFKRKTGKSIIQYLINHRIEQAKSLLVSANDPVTAIAAKSGFQDVRHFSKTFLKATGLTPREFRKQTQ